MVITSKCFFVRLRKRRRVDDDLAAWVSQYFGGIVIIVNKSVFNARHEFHADHMDVPAQERSIGRSHAETNDQCRSGPLAKKTEWKMSHEFCNRRQVGDANAVDEESFFHTLTQGCNSGCVVTPDHIKLGVATTRIFVRPVIEGRRS